MKFHSFMGWFCLIVGAEFCFVFFGYFCFFNFIVKSPYSKFVFFFE